MQERRRVGKRAPVPHGTVVPATQLPTRIGMMANAAWWANGSQGCFRAYYGFSTVRRRLVRHAYHYIRFRRHAQGYFGGVA